MGISQRRGKLSIIGQQMVFDVIAVNDSLPLIFNRLWGIYDLVAMDGVGLIWLVVMFWCNRNHNTAKSSLVSVQGCEGRFNFP